MCKVLGSALVLTDKPMVLQFHTFTVLYKTTYKRHNHVEYAAGMESIKEKPSAAICWWEVKQLPEEKHSLHYPY